MLILFDKNNLPVATALLLYTTNKTETQNHKQYFLGKKFFMMLKT